MKSVVKFDDTVSGIEEGLNAGCWTVGITNVHRNTVHVLEVQQWKKFDAILMEYRQMYSTGAVRARTREGKMYLFRCPLSVTDAEWTISSSRLSSRTGRPEDAYCNRFGCTRVSL